MKNNNIMFIGLFLTSVLMFVSGCEPIEDRDYLENSTDVSGVELVATQSTTGGNLIELSMATPGVTGYWDYNLDKAYTDKVEFIYPFIGTASFTFTGTLGAEFFTKTIMVQVDELSTPLDPNFYYLVGDDTVSGKTWVFAGGPDPDGQRWWYMSPPDDPTKWEEAWWNAAGDCCPPVDAAGRMHFDLDGAANYTYYSGPDASPQVGSFVLDVANQTLQINDGNILGAEQGNQDGLYTIVSLTEDQMILYVPNNAGGTGWTWIFRPE